LILLASIFACIDFACIHFACVGLATCLVPFESIRALDSFESHTFLSTDLTSSELEFEICTHIYTETPLRCQVAMVQVTCEEKTERTV
jgi:hypothetical protein